MLRIRAAVGLGVMWLTSVAAAQTSGGAAASRPASESSKPPASQPAFFPLNYSGNIAERSTLTGDWLGLRNEMAEHGVAFNVETLSVGQGNAHGGKSTNFNYFGSADYILQLDTQRMGLWPGGYFKIRGETEFGRAINKDVGAVSVPNFDTLLPAPGQPGLTTLTEYYMMQFLSPKFGIIAGQVDLTRLPGPNLFYSDPYNQFMNTAFWEPLAAFSVVPYAAMTAGIIYMPTKWLSGATLVIDSHVLPTVSGFETAFHSPQVETIMEGLTFNLKFCELEGHQRFNFAYSTREQIPLDDVDRELLAGVVAPQFDRLNVPRTLLVGGRNLRIRNILLREAISRAIRPAPTNSENWAFWYDFDQYFYQCPDDPKQGIGIFGSFGLTPGELFPVKESYTIGLAGKGVIPERPGDRYGIGYYYVNFSTYPKLLGLNAEQGVEMFYNFEVTPWLHITPDLQVIIDPGGATGGRRGRDPAIVYGLRMQVSF